LGDITTTYFLNLRLLNETGIPIANNFYWLSTKPDALDYQAKVTPWEYYTPSREYADLTGLNSLPPANVDVQCQIAGEGSLLVDLTNHSDTIAFFVELLLLDENTGEPVVPIFWQDNYVSLLPGETTRMLCGFDNGVRRPALIVRGWNTKSQRFCLTVG